MQDSVYYIMFLAAQDLAKTYFMFYATAAWLLDDILKWALDVLPYVSPD